MTLGLQKRQDPSSPSQLSAFIRTLLLGVPPRTHSGTLQGIHGPPLWGHLLQLTCKNTELRQVGSALQGTNGDRIWPWRYELPFLGCPVDDDDMR